MKPLRDSQVIRLASFNQGRRYSAIDFDYHPHLRFSNDHELEHDDDDDYCFGSKSGDFDIVDDWPAVNDKAQEFCRIFWESQQLMLQEALKPPADILCGQPNIEDSYWFKEESLNNWEILEQCNSSGTKLREQIKRNIDKARDCNLCNCLDKNIRGCIKCLRQAVVSQLCSKGFNATLRTSRWKRTHKMPGGSHEYIEVIASTQGRRKQIPFVVELGFQDEFKMAKASEAYDKLVDQLPEIYIGKTKNLNAIIRVVCEAARKSAKDRNIHMGPWRKRDFMEMKWSASSKSKVFSKSSNEFQVSSSRKGSSNAARASFELTVASTVKVA